MRGREQALDVGAVEVARREQVPALAAARRQQLARDDVQRTLDSSSRSSFLGLADEDDAVDLVDLEQLDLDALARAGRQVLADVVGPDRQLAVAAVGEDGELDAGGRPYSSSASIAARTVRPV